MLATESAKPEHEPAAKAPAPTHRYGRADRRRDRDLHECSGNGDPADGHQIGRREVQADAEHQQDHADLGKLGRHRRISRKAGTEGADGDARQEVADERREVQPDGHEAEREGHHEAQGHRDQQRRLVFHWG